MDEYLLPGEWVSCIWWPLGREPFILGGIVLFTWWMSALYQVEKFALPGGQVPGSYEGVPLGPEYVHDNSLNEVEMILPLL
jgi:hypothetical protein